VDKWVEIREINAREGTSNREALTLKTLRSGCDALYSAGTSPKLNSDTRQDGDIINGYGRHGSRSQFGLTFNYSKYRTPYEAAAFPK
jgi:hypothetical protein